MGLPAQTEVGHSGPRSVSAKIQAAALALLDETLGYAKDAQCDFWSSRSRSVLSMPSALRRTAFGGLFDGGIWTPVDFDPLWHRKVTQETLTAFRSASGKGDDAMRSCRWVLILASVALTTSTMGADWQKATPRLLLVENAVDAPNTAPILSRAVQTALPEFRVRILLKEGADLPASLEKYVLPKEVAGANWSKSSPTFDLRAGDREALFAAVESKDVRVIELLPPNHLPPVEDMFPAQLNIDARLSHFVNQFEGLHRGKGESVTMAVIDGGSVRATHVEFQPNRVTVCEPGQREHAHATHVAGTIGAVGIRSAARGMAPKIKIHSYTFFGNDLAKLNGAASDVWVSNHSYGPYTGWAQIRLSTGIPVWAWFGDANFGKYTVDCRRLDEILVTNDQLLSVVATGNDRDDGPLNQPVQHVEWFGNVPKWSSEIRELDGHKGGCDTISGLGVSKNALCVGAINDLFSNGQPIPGASIVSTFFSSWGPTDDGRIKPDVVANGQGLLSPTTPPDGAFNPDEVYEEMSGTSMASPTAAGIASVVAEYFHAKKGRRAKSPELKALLIHSTTDAGTPGPDPVFGYGSLNAFRAGEIIQGQNGEMIRYDSVSNAETKTYTLKRTSGPIRVTIAWLDPPSAANTGGLNDDTPALENNLDLLVKAPSGQEFHPYRLRRDSPLEPALNDGPNEVDNVEVVDVASPDDSGEWKIMVFAKRLSVGTQQQFAIVATGLKE